MIWLELRKNIQTYNKGWNFSESVWAPTKKADGSKWPFWYLINDVKKHDFIFHLCHTNNHLEFIGYSLALGDAYETHAVPTNDNHGWGFSDSFYKVDLIDYHQFKTPIQLSNFFQTNEQYLRDFFHENRQARGPKKRIFYVIQRGSIQCLNGAYFSEFDGVLIDLLTAQIKNYENQGQIVLTGETSTNLKIRIGHRQFAENVKRNYNYKCCFPGCEIHGRGFLVSGHISRWADNEELRGNTQNGLSLCLLHDRAFEKGYFTLDRELKVRVIQKNLEKN